MKKITLVALVSLLFVGFASAQNSPRFKKTIENNFSDDTQAVDSDWNVITEGRYNFDSKSVRERRFFGDFNAEVEYFFDRSFQPAAGFRIYRDSLDEGYLLEMKIFAIKNKQTETTNGKITSKSVKVSDAFAERLYNKTFATISTYTATGIPRMSFDGETVTFRAVAGHDLWTLWIHNPEGDAENLSVVFRQLITDVDSGNFDESKYLKLLDN